MAKSKTSKDSRKLPSSFKRAQAEFPAVLKGYEEFARATERSGPLSKREQRLVKLGLAFGARMEGGAHSAIRKALEAGLSPAEIKQAALLAMPTIGFPNAMACMSWVRDIVEE
jgi:4-carboxymuconolactone decarboxylase